MTKPTIVLGFASFQDDSYELIVRDEVSGEETVLHGKLQPGQFEIINRILPTCVYVKARTA